MNTFWAKLAEETPCDKIYVGIIWVYTIFSKGKKKELVLKNIRMVNFVVGCFEVYQYDNNYTTTIEKLVETI